MRNTDVAIFSYKNLAKTLFAFLILIPSISLSAPLFYPGETLNPGCLPTDPDCTVSTSTTVGYSYASSTFPSFIYGSSTYYLASNPAGYLTLSTDPWMMASSSYLSTTSASNLYPTFTYSSSTFVNYSYSSSTFLTLSSAIADYVSTTTLTTNYPTFTYASSSFVNYGYASSTFASTSWVTSNFIPYTGGTSAVNLGANNLTVDTDTFFVNASTNRVGIGETNPSTKLQIVGGSDSVESTVQIVGNGISTLFLGQDFDGGILRGQGGNNSLKFLVGGGAGTQASDGTEAMRILSNGNVGIGTTTPSTALSVIGTTTSSGLNITSLASTFLAIDTNGNVIATTSPLSILAASSTYLRLDTSNGPLTGNLNIATTSAELRITNTGSSQYARFVKSSSTNALTIYNRVSVPAASATGGTITNSGAYIIHTFTSSGTFTTTGTLSDVEVLIVAGGGGGGATGLGGGGGAGGVIASTTFTVSGGANIVTVGAGGSAGTNGGDSTFNGATAVGGGRGAGESGTSANSGGSGGGGVYNVQTGGAGTAGQGFAGGDDAGGNPPYAGGGGGAGGAGPAQVGSTSGNGGPGISSSISGSSVTYACGGGGGGFSPAGGAAGVGGCASAGNGNSSSGGTGSAATANSGSGGGGGAGGGGAATGGVGGSGIVIIRYIPQVTIQEATVITSVDGSNEGEYGINTFGDTNGRSILNGTSVRFNTFNTERAIIDSNGNFGLGTTTPFARLDIYGTSTATTTDLFAVSSSSNTRLFTIKSSGNVGIGTSTPLAALTIVSVNTNPFAFAVYSATGTATGSAITINTGIGSATSTPSDIGYAGGDFFITTGTGGASNGGGGTGGRGGSMSIILGNGGDGSAGGGGAGGSFSLVAGTGASALGSGAAGTISFTAGHGAAGMSPSAGGSITLTAGNGASGPTPSSAGNILLIPGNPYSTGQEGRVGIGTSSPIALLSVMASSTSGTSPFIAFNSTTTPIFNILTNGNVGIGTTTPTRKFEVFATGTNPIANFSNGSNASMLYVGATSVGIRTTDNEYHLNINNSLGNPSGDLNMYAGSVGGGLPGDVTIAAAVDGTATQDGNILILAGVDLGGTGTAGNSSITIQNEGTGGINLSAISGNTTINSGSSNVVMQSGVAGRVGIGTSTPLAKFEVYGRAGNNAIINFASSSNASVLYIGANGFVGIGTTTPNTALSVIGTSTLQDVIPMGPYTGNMSTFSLGASTTRWLSVWAQNVNIGTSTWSLAQTGTRFGIFNSANASGTEALTILSNGNVGIGTTTPSSALSIVGDAHFSGNITASQLGSTYYSQLVTASSTSVDWSNGSVQNLDFSSSTQSNTVAYFKFENNLNDELGGSSATNNGAISYTSGASAGGVDGGSLGVTKTATSSGTSIDIPLAAINNNSGTVEFAFKHGPGVNQTILWIGSTGVTDSRLVEYGTISGAVRGHINGGGSFNTGPALVVDNWYYGAFTWDQNANQTKFYIADLNPATGDITNLNNFYSSTSLQWGTKNANRLFNGFNGLDAYNGSGFDAIKYSNVALTSFPSVESGVIIPISFSNPVVGGRYTVTTVQNAAGTINVSWPGNIIWPGDIEGSMSSNANAIDTFEFVYDGTNYIAQSVSPSTLIANAIYPAVNSVNAVAIKNAGGAATILSVDTTNSRIGIGTTTPSATLSVDGTIRFIDLGSAGGGLITDTDGNVTVSSDERLKDIQNNYERGLEDVMKIVPISYKWKTETGYETKNVYTGFSAQNMKLAIPEAVSTSSSGYLNLADRPIIAALVNAVKQIGSFIDKIEGGIAYLKDIVISKLTIGSESIPAGITMYDRTTKQPYCVSVNNGVLYNEAGTCPIGLPEVNNTASVINTVIKPTVSTTTTEVSTSTASTTEPTVEATSTNPVVEEATSTPEVVEEPVIETPVEIFLAPEEATSTTP